MKASYTAEPKIPGISALRRDGLFGRGEPTAAFDEDDKVTDVLSPKETHSMTKYSVSACITLVLIWLLCALTGAEAEEKEPLSEWGRELFSVYCVACHGFSGRGEGPSLPS